MPKAWAVFVLLVAVGVLAYAAYTFSLFPAEFPDSAPAVSQTPVQAVLQRTRTDTEGRHKTLPQLLGGCNALSFTQVARTSSSTAGAFPDTKLGELLYKVPRGRKATTLAVVVTNSGTASTTGPAVVGLCSESFPASTPVFAMISCSGVPSRTSVPLKAPFVFGPGDTVYFWGVAGLDLRLELVEFDDEPGTPESLVVDVSAQKEVRVNAINESLILLQPKADGLFALATCHNDLNAANFSWLSAGGGTESNALVAAPGATVPHCSVLKTNFPAFLPGSPVTFSSTAATSASLHAVMLTVLRIPDL